MMIPTIESELSKPLHLDLIMDQSVSVRQSVKSLTMKLAGVQSPDLLVSRQMVVAAVADRQLPPLVFCRPSTQAPVTTHTAASLDATAIGPHLDLNLFGFLVVAWRGGRAAVGANALTLGEFADFLNNRQVAVIPPWRTRPTLPPDKRVFHDADACDPDIASMRKPASSRKRVRRSFTSLQPQRRQAYDAP